MVPPEQPAAAPGPVLDDQLPDTALFWRWVGRATRPVVGWVLAAAGVIAIIVGYFGVSREALVAKQIPYLVSGGILGLALVGLGAAFIATDDLRRDATRLDRLEAMITDLYEILLSQPDVAAPAPTTSRRSGSGSTASRSAPSETTAPGSTPSGPSASNGRSSGGRAASLVALPSGHTFHRSGCSMVEGKAGVTGVDAEDIRRRRLEPCRLCEPVAVSA